MFTLIPWTEDLDLDEFYIEAARRGFDNNSSQKKMIDCLRNEKDWAAWILYQDNCAIGSVAAHSFDIMGPKSYRICVRTCLFVEARPKKSLATKYGILEHQNATAQFFIPKCIEWAGEDKNLYITSNENSSGSQKLMHNIAIPLLKSIGVVDKVKEMMYRNTLQTIWKLNTNTFLQQLRSYPRWLYE